MQQHTIFPFWTSRQTSIESQSVLDWGLSIDTLLEVKKNMMTYCIEWTISIMGSLYGLHSEYVVVVVVGALTIGIRLSEYLNECEENQFPIILA